MILTVLSALGINKTGARLILALAIAAAAAAVALWISNLQATAEAYTALRAAVTSLEQQYGCDDRPEHERDLAACLAARDRAVAEAQRDALDRQREAAARAQAALDREWAKAQQQAEEDEKNIRAAGADEDGPGPKVLLDSWSRARKERGLK